jgi:thiamine-phosphate pyrophosphorylase
MTPRRGAARIRGLYGILDPSVLLRAFPGGDADSLLDRALAASLAGGIPVVQYRDKEASPRLLLARATRLSAACREAGALFLVNDRLDVAILCGADGCHLGQDDLPLPEARKASPPGFLLGASTHDAREALRARGEGADYIGVGAVYATSTKEDVTAPGGAPLVADVHAAVPALPIVAIAGITLGNALPLFRAGAAAVAVSHDLYGRADVRERTEAYLRLCPP